MRYRYKIMLYKKEPTEYLYSKTFELTEKEKKETLKHLDELFTNEVEFFRFENYEGGETWISGEVFNKKCILSLLLVEEDNK